MQPTTENYHSWVRHLLYDPFCPSLSCIEKITYAVASVFLAIATFGTLHMYYRWYCLDGPKWEQIVLSNDLSVKKEFIKVVGEMSPVSCRYQHIFIACCNEFEAAQLFGSEGAFIQYTWLITKPQHFDNGWQHGDELHRACPWALSETDRCRSILIFQEKGEERDEWLQGLNSNEDVKAFCTQKENKVILLRNEIDFSSLELQRELFGTPWWII